MWALSTCGEPNEFKTNTHPTNTTALYAGLGRVGLERELLALPHGGRHADDEPDMFRVV